MRRNILAETTVEDDGIVTVLPSTAPADVDLFFDYTSIEDQGLAIEMSQRARRIKAAHRKATASILEVGAELAELQGKCQDGLWTTWLETEFGMDIRSAQYFIGINRRFSANPEVMNLLSPTGLRLLAAPSVDDQTVDEVLEEARKILEETGRQMPTRAVSSAIKDKQNGGSLGGSTKTSGGGGGSTKSQGTAVGKCSVCNRPLSNPTSAAAGVGPVCACKGQEGAGGASEEPEQQEIEGQEYITTVTTFAPIDPVEHLLSAAEYALRAIAKRFPGTVTMAMLADGTFEISTSNGNKLLKVKHGDTLHEAYIKMQEA